MNREHSWRISGFPLVVLLLCAIFLQSCASLPSRSDFELEYSLPPAQSGALSEMSDRFIGSAAPESSGFHLLIDSKEALEARLALIDMATTSIDLQYFIWKGDAVGTLLFDRLLIAADRGVKVRIIVDDIWLESSIRNLTALNLHPNLEIRIFNPNPSRDVPVSALLHQLASFQELNQRMHNKLMIVDNLAAIAGGRNIGDEYFGLGKKFNFLDIDVLAVGAVIAECSDAFDDYWNTNSVFPVSAWKVKLKDITLEDVVDGVSASKEEYEQHLTSYPVDPIDWQPWATELEAELIRGEAHFLQDDPVSIDGVDYRLVDMIGYFADPTHEEFILSSPYLIPVGDFFKTLEEGVNKGVQIRLFTNSLASTNHTMVNSHYKKYRKRILDKGGRLYEFNHQPSEQIRALADVDPVTAKFISLHAKVMVSDRKKCFIGSLNFDPRALVINSENGLLIDSPEFSRQLAEILDEVMAPHNSWQVSLSEQGGVEWQSQGELRTSQPGRSIFQKVGDFFYRFLPIEGQL